MPAAKPAASATPHTHRRDHWASSAHVRTLPAAGCEPAFDVVDELVVLVAVVVDQPACRFPAYGLPAALVTGAVLAGHGVMITPPGLHCQPLGCTVVGMSTKYTSETGDSVAIDPTAVQHIKALETLTGRPTDDLLNEAVNDIRQKLVPSTRPAPIARPGRKAKDNK
jgi:hypothetical protein